MHRPRRSAVGLVVALCLVVLAACRPSAGVDPAAHPFATTAVTRAHRAAFGRAPTGTERARWTPGIVATGRARPMVVALLATAEHRNGIGALADSAFVEAVYRNAGGRAPTADERRLWGSALTAPSGRVDLVTFMAEQGPGAAAPPQPTVACSRFDRGGTVPACVRDGSGDQRAVAIVKVPGTNLYVNRAWYPNVLGFVNAARAAGYTLTGETDPSVPSWMLSPGSWRSWDDQQWLSTHVDPSTGKPYPANPPGRSMHEWGLALDLMCNGTRIDKVRACWDWVRANGPTHGVRMFSTVTAPTQSEAWHVSSNGR